MSAIATALTHAHDQKLLVEVLVEGHWLRGDVALVDGFGVVLDRENGQGQSVVRVESIAAVTVTEQAVQENAGIGRQRGMAVVR